jgi:hypothetical protein
MSFSRIDEVLDMPNLIEVQKNSYKRFLTEDLKEVLADVSPITDYSENLVLEFVDYSLDSKPKNDVERCRERDLTFAAPLKVSVRLKNRETGEIIIDPAELEREGWIDEGRHDQGSDHRDADRLGGGDDVRRDELADRAQVEPGGQKDRQLDLRSG